MQLALGSYGLCLKVWGSNCQSAVHGQSGMDLKLYVGLTRGRHYGTHILRTNQYVGTNVKQTRADVGMSALNSVSGILCSC